MSPMNNRSIYGLHILPSKKVSEEKYNLVRAEIEKTGIAIENYFNAHKEQRQNSFISTYSINKELALTISYSEPYGVQVGIYVKSNQIIIQSCNIEYLLCLLSPAITKFHERCSALLLQRNNPKFQQVIPEHLQNAWKVIWNKLFVSSEENEAISADEELRWHTYGDEDFPEYKLLR